MGWGLGVATWPQLCGSLQSSEAELQAITAFKCQSLSCVQPLATPWTVTHQVPLSTEFSRQEYWSGYPFSSPAGLLNPGIKPRSPALQVDTLPLSHQGSPLELFLTLTSSLLGISSKKRSSEGQAKIFAQRYHLWHYLFLFIMKNSKHTLERLVQRSPVYP